MHSGYGGAETHHIEQQTHLHGSQQQQSQYMDFCFPLDFSISSPRNLTHHASPPPPQLQQQQEQHRRQDKQAQHCFLQHHHQLFQQQQFRPFQSQQEQSRLNPLLRLQQQHNPLPSTVDFKLGLDGKSSDIMGAVLNREDGPVTNFVHGSGHIPPDLVISRCWHPREDSATIEAFWKPIDSCDEKPRRGSEEQEFQDGNNSRCYNVLHGQKVDENSERCDNLTSKSAAFGELEAIYSIASIAETNQTVSGSALTGENSPANADMSIPFSVKYVQNVGGIGAGTSEIGVDHGSENSLGDEASTWKRQKTKRKRETYEKWSYIAQFMDNMVKKTLEHQKKCHREILEVIEMIDKERTEREETWRRQEIVKYDREALARTHEQTLASIREAQIVTYIEKITGRSVDLPVRRNPSPIRADTSKADDKEPTTATKTVNSNRWPKDEVEALIQVRSSIEKKFQQPGLKGPLWVEVSSLMSSMGYQRSAKRCKEKWENINKYFRKAREATKKKSLQSKTCSYFNQLDEIYASTTTKYPHHSTTVSVSSSIGEVGIVKQGPSELIETFAAGNKLETFTNSSSEYPKTDEMGSSRSEHDTG